MEVSREALTIARAIVGEFDRAEVLARIAPHLPSDAMAEALAIVYTISGEETRANALTDLVSHLPEESRDSICRETLAIACSCEEYGYLCAYAIAGLAPYLSNDLKNEALAAARALTIPDERSRALAGLMPHLSDDLRPTVGREALPAAHAIAAQDDYARALANLAFHIPDDLKLETLSRTHFLPRLQSALVAPTVILRSSQFGTKCTSQSFKRRYGRIPCIH